MSHSNLIKEDYLTNQHPNTRLHKVPDSPRIFLQVTACKSLICTVEECIVSFTLHHSGNLLPLFLRRIYSSGIVCAGMEEKDGVGFCGRQGRNECREIE